MNRITFEIGKTYPSRNKGPFYVVSIEEETIVIVFDDGIQVSTTKEILQNMLEHMDAAADDGLDSINQFLTHQHIALHDRANESDSSEPDEIISPVETLLICQKVLKRFPPSSSQIRVLCLLAGFCVAADMHSSAAQLVSEIRGNLKTVLSTTSMSTLEQVDFLLEVHELLAEAIIETQSNPTFASRYVFDILKASSASGIGMPSARPRALRLRSFLKRVSSRRFCYASQDAEIRSNADKLHTLLREVGDYLGIKPETSAVNSADSARIQRKFSIPSAVSLGGIFVS